MSRLSRYRLPPMRGTNTSRGITSRRRSASAPHHSSMEGTISSSHVLRCASNQSRSLFSTRPRKKDRPLSGKPAKAIGGNPTEPPPAREALFLPLSAALPGAVAQVVEVVLFAARLLGLLDADAADHAVLVDDEGAALGVARLAHEDAVLLRHVPLGVEIGEQR